VLGVIAKGVIEREEKYLERKFGDEYRQYKARVRRRVSRRLVGTVCAPSSAGRGHTGSACSCAIEMAM
jgi:hypothetical protein